MFRGSKRVPGDLRDRLLRERGARGNAYTTNDVTVFFEDVSAEHLPLVIELEAERFRNLEISPQVLDTERQVVLEERRMRTGDNPNGRLIEALLSLTFVAHPYRTPTIGWQSDVEKVDAETCREFFRAYYVPNNVVISIAGDFDAEDAIARIRRALRLLGARAGAAAQPDRGARAAAASGAAWCTLPVRAPLVGAAWHAPNDGPPRRPGPRRALRDPLRGPHQPAAAQARLRSAGGALGLRRLLGAGARRALLRGRRGPARQVPEPRRGGAVRRDRAPAGGAAHGARAREGEARLRGVAHREPAHRQRPRLAGRRGAARLRADPAASTSGSKRCAP